MSGSDPFPAPCGAGILLDGGSGRRAGFTKPKQRKPLVGKPVLRWSLDAFAAHPAISAGVLVAGDDVVAAAGGLPAGWLAAAPGAERQQSVASGLAALASWDDADIGLEIGRASGRERVGQYG